MVFFLIFAGVLVSPKMKIIGLGAWWQVQKSPNHGNEEFVGSPISKSRFYYTNSKQNNSPELLNLLLKHTFQTKWPNNDRFRPTFFLWCFPSFWCASHDYSTNCHSPGGSSLKGATGLRSISCITCQMSSAPLLFSTEYYLNKGCKDWSRVLTLPL